MTELEKIYIRVGKNITFLRNKKNLTQEQLALEKDINSSQSLISQYERGKKYLSLEKMEEFACFFGVTLEELMFSEYKNEEKNNSKSVDMIDKGDPIHKCVGRTYYCYYIKEQNGPKGEFLHKITHIELKILSPISSHEAKAQILFPDRQKAVEMEAVLQMDESYAYVKCHDVRRDFYFELTFYYHRQSLLSKYDGGMGLLRTMDFHKLPICQFCIISANAVSARNQPFLEKYLQFEMKEDLSLKMSSRTVSSQSILRLTKKMDSKVYDWLRQNAGL